MGDDWTSNGVRYSADFKAKPFQGRVLFARVGPVRSRQVTQFANLDTRQMDDDWSGSDGRGSSGGESGGGRSGDSADSRANPIQGRFLFAR